MSISRFQDRIFKSGCGVVVLLVSGAAMGFGLLYTSCGKGLGGQQAPDQTAVAAITLGSQSISADDVQSMADASAAQYSQNGADPGPVIRSFALTQAMQTAVEALANAQVATNLGVKLDDASIRAFVASSLDKEIDQAKSDLVTSGALKPGFTQQQFINAFQSKYKGTPDDLKKRSLDNLDATLSDPEKRNMTVLQSARSMAAEAIKKGLSVSDADLRASYNSYVFKRLILNPPGKSPTEIDTLAQKVIDEINGGLSFEAAIDKYSTESPIAKQKLSDKTLTYRNTDLQSNPDLKALGDLKVGQVSMPMAEPAGKSIYKLISTKPQLPADFDKNIAKYRDQYLDTMAANKLRDQVDQLTKSDQIKFPLPGFKAAYDLSKLGMMGMATGPDAQAKGMAVVKEAEAALKDQYPSDDRVAALTLLSAIQGVYSQATDKAAVEKDHIAALQAVLGAMESFEVRMDLVDAGLASKDSDLAIENLKGAIGANSSYDATGQTRFRQISDKIAALKKANLLPAAAESDLNQMQQTWRTAKLADDKEQAQFKAQQAADKAASDAAKAKLDAENKKAMDEAKKQASQKPAAPTPGSNPPSPSTPAPGPSGKGR